MVTPLPNIPIAVTGVTECDHPNTTACDPAIHSLSAGVRHFMQLNGCTAKQWNAVYLYNIKKRKCMDINDHEGGYDSSFDF